MIMNVKTGTPTKNVNIMINAIDDVKIVGYDDCCCCRFRAVLC
jgi:hypothetical protein